jgi:hypothetical protein
MEEGQLGTIQLVVAGQHGYPADVTAQHAGPLHIRQSATEGESDALLEVTFPQSDAKLAAQDGGDVSSREWLGSLQERTEDTGLVVPAPGLGKGIEPICHLLQGQVRRPCRLVAGIGKQLTDGGPQVRRAVVGSTHRALVRAGDSLHDGRDRRPAQAGLALVSLGERSPTQEARRDGHLGLVEGAQVCRHDGCLLARLRCGTNGFGGLRPAQHRACRRHRHAVHRSQRG